MHTERIIRLSPPKLSIRSDIKGNVLKGLWEIFASVVLRARVNMQFRAQRAICQSVCCSFLPKVREEAVHANSAVLFQSLFARGHLEMAHISRSQVQILPPGTGFVILSGGPLLPRNES